MAVKLADTLQSMNPSEFPVAMADGVNIVKEDGSEKSLQSMYEDGELGGSGLPEPESADKVLLSGSSNTRADGLEWKQVSKNDVGMQLPEFESLDEWNNLPAEEKSKYYNAGKGYVVIKEDVKGAKGVIDDTKPNSTVTTLSAKKIGDNLGGKADASKVVPKITITDTTTADAKTIIEKNWSTFPAETSTATIGTSNYGYNALINKQGKYGTVMLTTPVSGEPFYYGVLGGSSWTWKKLATMDKVAEAPIYVKREDTSPSNKTYNLNNIPDGVYDVSATFLYQNNNHWYKGVVTKYDSAFTLKAIAGSSETIINGVTLSGTSLNFGFAFTSLRFAKFGYWN